MNLLCVMDPLKKLNPVWDNTLFILSELHARGHACWVADAPDLISKRQTLWVRAARLIPSSPKKKGPHRKRFLTGKREIQEIKNFDLVLIRKEPPVDQKFLAMTRKLEKFSKQIPMVNHPRGIRECNEKLSTLRFPQHAPKTLVSSSVKEILKFWEKTGKDIVVKPLNQKGGIGVFRIQAQSPGIVRRLRRAARMGRETLMAQEFLKAKRSVEKRIVLLNGKVLCAYEKRPRPGEFRGNLDLGASFHETELSAVEKQIIRDIRKFLLRNGLFFVGLDVLNGKLLEINTTCPAGVTEARSLRPGLQPERAWVSFLEAFAR